MVFCFFLLNYSRFCPTGTSQPLLPVPVSLEAPAVTTSLPSVSSFILLECNSNRQYHGKSHRLGVSCTPFIQAIAELTGLETFPHSSSFFFSHCCVAWPNLCLCYPTHCSLLISSHYFPSFCNKLSLHF